MEKIQDPGVIWLIGTMGAILLTIVGFFLHHHYKATTSFIDEVRLFNATTGQKIVGLTGDVVEIKTEQTQQNKRMNIFGERLAKVETKVEN